MQTFVPGILFDCRMTHRFHISLWTVETPATVHRYIRGKIYLPDSQTVPQILNGLLFILSRQFNNQREVMASFPFKEALFVGCKALWDKPVWEVCVWYRALLRHAWSIYLCGDCNCNGFWRQRRRTWQSEQVNWQLCHSRAEQTAK